MGALILDASVLIGLLDAADAHHERALIDIETADHAGRTLIVPASAYSEALVAFARAGRLGDARSAVAAMGIEVAPLTAAMAERAAQLRASRRHLRLPDAMVVACAREMRGELLTYDDRLASHADAGCPIPPPSSVRRRGNETVRDNEMRWPST